MNAAFETRRDLAGHSTRLTHDDATGALFWTSHGRDGQREHLALGDAHRAVAAYEEYAATLVGCEETDCAGVLAGIHHSIRRDTQTGADYELIFVNGKLVDIEPAEPPRAI
jgi:hypothetical protein